MSENPPPSAGEVRALANQLLNWADKLAENQQLAQDLANENGDRLVLRQAEAALEAQRLRARIFPDCDFGNPAWQTLLELFARQLAGFRTSLDQLALEGPFPAPTVYRCVETLHARGLLERTPDRFDPRVVWLGLSTDGQRRMREFLRRASDAGRSSPARDLQKVD